MTDWTTKQRAARDSALRTLLHYFEQAGVNVHDPVVRDELGAAVDNLATAARPDPDGTAWPVEHSPPRLDELAPAPYVGQHLYLRAVYSGEPGSDTEYRAVCDLHRVVELDTRQQRIVCRLVERATDHGEHSGSAADQVIESVDWPGQYPGEGPIDAICTRSVINMRRVLCWWSHPLDVGTYCEPAAGQQVLLADGRWGVVEGLLPAGGQDSTDCIVLRVLDTDGPGGVACTLVVLQLCEWGDEAHMSRVYAPGEPDEPIWRALGESVLPAGVPSPRVGQRLFVQGPDGLPTIARVAAERHQPGSGQILSIVVELDDGTAGNLPPAGWCTDEGPVLAVLDGLHRRVLWRRPPSVPAAVLQLQGSK